jgi:predicted  nucleic acid-binding Zn-ribbon protein
VKEQEIEKLQDELVACESEVVLNFEKILDIEDKIEAAEKTLKTYKRLQQELYSKEQ